MSQPSHQPVIHARLDLILSLNSLSRSLVLRIKWRKHILLESFSINHQHLIFSCRDKDQFSSNEPPHLLAHTALLPSSRPATPDICYYSHRGTTGGSRWLQEAPGGLQGDSWGTAEGLLGDTISDKRPRIGHWEADVCNL